MPRSEKITHANPVGLRPATTARISFADLFFWLGKTQENGRREFGDVSDPTDRISQIGRRYWSSNQRDLRYSSLCSCGLSSQTARSLGWRRSANEPGWLLTFFSFPAPAFQNRPFAFLVHNRPCARRQSGEAGRGAGRCLEVHAQVLCESDMTYGSSRARSVTKRICRSSCWLARLGRMEEDVSRVFDKSGTAEPPTPVARALLSHWLNSTAARWEVPRAAWSMAVRLAVRVGRWAQRSAG